VIISRTPFRISFFGGGTDYPVWYREHGGSVLATTIDKYCYISCRYLPPFFEHKSRIAYAKIETVKSNRDIEHPAVRGVLSYLKIEDGVEIHHDGDLPARTGLGSSSSFTVGLLHALYALRQIMPTKMQLIREAIHIEQNVLRENVGCQDQSIAAYGGLCQIDFAPGDDIRVTPVIVSRQRLVDLQAHLLLYFTGFSRTASEIAKEQIERTKDRTSELSAMFQLVSEGLSVLTGDSDLTSFGTLLHEGWKLKRSLTSKISSSEIDQIYDAARKVGCIGGKLLGAGGGGFMLLFAKPEDHCRIRKALNRFLCVPFSFEVNGSQIMLYEPGTLIERNYPEMFRAVEAVPVVPMSS
jgi:D-glycero-alpha-D-manno-heptose-7-phosphate kinase